MSSFRVLGLLLLLSATAAADDKPFGLEQRRSWDDSKVVGSPDPITPYKVERAFPNLTFKQPLTITPEPGTDRLFVLEHMNYWAGPGKLQAFKDDQGSTKAELLLDIDALPYGVAFHPDYLRNGYIYLSQNGPTRGEKKSQVVRYTVDRRPPHGIDPASRLLIIEWPSNGHNGCDVAFGNDGTLFISSGDGSSDSDSNSTGQTLDDLLAAVLRIDVDHPEGGRPYGIPKDNPFVDRPGAKGEVWAYGLRNPWRLTYDRPSGQLWAGNNGQDLWEQVYLVQKGANYGWSVSEGSHVFHSNRPAGPDPISPPVAEHSHGESRSLTGGQVYRGKRLPELVGTYVYGDWSTGKVWGVKSDGKTVVGPRELVDTPFNITGFGTDHAGELYVIDQVGGTFQRLVPTTEADQPKQPFPTRLSETGLFASVPELKPHPAALPYDVTAPQWADGATMQRFAAVPGSERIEQKSQKNAGGAWTFPNGTVLAQTLSLDLVDGAGKAAKKRVETRLMTRQQNEWVGYSYRWNDAQTDAELVPATGGADDLEVADPAEAGGRRTQTWRYPSRAECLVCHSRAAGFVLGFTPLQLDRDHNYGATTDNQLRTLDHIGMFQGPLPARKDDRRKLVDPYDPGAPAEARVKAYLHVNCSHCHVGEGGGNSKMELGWNTRLDGMRIVNQRPIHNAFELPDARLIAPGDPDRSFLPYRLASRGAPRMPPLVQTEVDAAALRLITEWIRTLPKPAAE